MDIRRKEILGRGRSQKVQRPCGRSILSVAEVEEGGAVCWEMKTERQQPDHVRPHKPQYGRLSRCKLQCGIPAYE